MKVCYPRLWAFRGPSYREREVWQRLYAVSGKSQTSALTSSSLLLMCNHAVYPGRCFFQPTQVKILFEMLLGEMNRNSVHQTHCTKRTLAGLNSNHLQLLSPGMFGTCSKFYLIFVWNGLINRNMKVQRYNKVLPALMLIEDWAFFNRYIIILRCSAFVDLDGHSEISGWNEFYTY